VDGILNAGEAITHEVEVNIHFKEHIEREKMDICDIRKANMISSILCPVAHNPEINWEKGEVKMVRCLVICG